MQTQARAAGTNEEALAIVHMKMIKGHSKTLTVGMSSRGRNGEACRRENQNVWLANAM